ncbi:hypothetical protein C1I97_15215 [Streptomyces sp. NTH33]|nr:hypothetical protein C1I97_15215 [Streptomyces sp. NTH33]
MPGIVHRVEPTMFCIQWRCTLHGLPGISARNTAMLEAITDLPPIVVSDLFGVHPHTAYAWAQYAQNSWAEYLEAVQSTD